MIVFPHAKINIGLYITEKRPDGFHNLQTCFFPVDIHDALEILPALPGQDTTFTSTGLPIPGNPEHNLCLRAYQILHRQLAISPVRMHLHKVIPISAGLGGGSSDAAFALNALNHLFCLKLTQDTLEGYASQIGSDCAFFLQSNACIGTGKGDILSPATLSLSGHHIAVIMPPLGVNTAEAYRNIVPAHPQIPLDEQLTQPIQNWKNFLFNDFEKTVFPKHPEIARIKESLYAQGATYAAMTGSGSAVFGLFTDAPTLPNLRKLFPGCQVFA